MKQSQPFNQPGFSLTNHPNPPPPQVLLDGSFIHMALQVKMDILDRVKKLLLGEAFKCFVPR